MSDVIERIRRDGPTFHADRSGRAISLSVSPVVLRELQRHLRTGPTHTLEVGCGATTVVFGEAACHHCCVTPRSEEGQRVVEYCRTIGVGTDRLDFVVGRSEHVLPTMVDRGPLQFILIDGGHRFPYPILDFHYTQHRLERGGIVAIDDVSIPAVAVLYDFLSGEREWKRIALVEEMAFFERVQKDRDGDWTDQRFNQPSPWRRGAEQLRRVRPSRVLARIRRMLRDR